MASPHFPKLNLGGRLQQARTAAGMSQGRLARALDVSPQAVSAWENNRSKPEVDRLLQIAHALGVSSSWLLTGQFESTADAVSQQNPAVRRRPSSKVDDLHQTHPWLQGSPGLPVHEVLPSDDDPNCFYVTDNILEFFVKPMALHGTVRRNQRVSLSAFGIRYPGGPMQPRFYPGDLLVIDPDWPAEVGSDAFIQFVGPFNYPRLVTVGHVQLLKDESLTIQRFTPPQSVNIDGEGITFAHRILTIADLLDDPFRPKSSTVD